MTGMPETPSLSLLASYLIQAAGALFTAVLFGLLSRTYRKPFLLHWARSWSAMCVMLVGAAFAAAIASTGAPTSARRLTISTVTAVAAYLQIAWLLLGCAEMVAAPAAGAVIRKRAWFLGSAVAIGL